MRSSLISLLILYSCVAFSQSSIISAGYQNGGATLKVEWTVGELLTENFSGQNVQVAQGLNELINVFIITEDIEEESASTSIYPVPFADHFFIEPKDRLLLRMSSN